MFVTGSFCHVRNQTFLSRSRNIIETSVSALILCSLKMYFCPGWCECLFCFLFIFLSIVLIQQHSHGSTNSTFRKIDLLYSAFGFYIVIQFSIEWFTAFYWCLEYLKAGYLESANLKTLFKDSVTYQTVHKIWSLKSFFQTTSKRGWEGLFTCS